MYYYKAIKYERIIYRKPPWILNVLSLGLDLYDLIRKYNWNRFDALHEKPHKMHN